MSEAGEPMVLDGRVLLKSLSLQQDAKNLETKISQSKSESRSHKKTLAFGEN
jgi:hypothetical protein